MAALLSTVTKTGWREGDTGLPGLTCSRASVLSRAGGSPAGPGKWEGGCELPPGPRDLEFCLHGSTQEMGIDFLGLAPGWNETEIEKILSNQEMIPPGN